MQEVLDFGEVELPNWQAELLPRQLVAFREVGAKHGPRAAYLLHDITYVRTWIRKRRAGESEEATGYRVQVTWPSGETVDWEFDKSVGWPSEGGVVPDWHGDWMKNYGGVA